MAPKTSNGLIRVHGEGKIVNPRQPYTTAKRAFTAKNTLIDISYMALTLKINRPFPSSKNSYFLNATENEFLYIHDNKKNNNSILMASHIASL